MPLPLPRPSVWKTSALKPLTIQSFGGLNTSRHPEQIGDNESPDLLNITIRDGTVRTRPGTSEVGSTGGTDITRGLFAFKKQSGSLLYIRAQGGKIQSATSLAGPWTDRFTGGNTSALWSFAVANDTLYAINGVDTPQKWDGVAGTTSNASGVKNGTTMVYKFDRLLVGLSNQLWYSDPITPETFQSTSSFNVGKDDGGTLLQILDGGPSKVDIVKDNGRYEWYGGIGTGDAPRKMGSYGAVGPRASVVLPSGETWMFTRAGIRRQFSTSDELMSPQIVGTLKNLTWAQSANFAAGFFDNYVIFSVAAFGSTYPNLWLMFDLIAGGWLLWSLQSSVFLTTVDASGNPTLLFGNASGNSKVMQLGSQDAAESTFNDLGAAYDAHYVTKQFNAGIPDHQKKFKKLLYSFAQQQANYSVTLSYNPDDESWTDFLVNLGPGAVITYDSSLLYDTGLIYADRTRITALLPMFSTGWMKTISFKAGMNAANQPFRLFFLVPHFRVKPSIG